MNTSYGVFGPYVTANWVHEFENNNPSIFARYVSDPTNQQFFIPTATPTRDYAVLGVGSTGTFKDNFSGFLQFAAAVGLKDQTNYGVTRRYQHRRSSAPPPGRRDSRRGRRREG